MSHIVVIGAGQAGQSLVTKLRALGFEGELTLIGDEPVPPYQRPPLSKKYLLGEMDVERLYLRPRTFYDEQNITLRLGKAVTGIDATARTISLGDKVISYDQLALTTGSVPRTLPASIGGDLNGVYTVRTLADVDRMTAEFQPDRRILIVGGGYIGLEAAAVAARLGLKVTLVEMADRILQRVAAVETSDHMRAQHSAAEVSIIEGVGLERLVGTDRVTGAILTDGTEIPVDFVIVGVGITPDTRLAETANITLDNGISTDSFGRTSDPAIWAAGDCASFPHKDGRIRLESVGNAIDQAEIVAENMLGGDKEYIAKPWFWSDQFDVKLQIAGLNTGYDNVVTRVGEKEGATSFWYYKGDQLLAVDAINDPRAYMVGKRLIEMGKSPDADTVSNPETNLKALLKA
ncbi:MAG: NAD(P)/FAD-dependent oxidoreductase [Paracoccaceae bacterium]